MDRVNIEKDNYKNIVPDYIIYGVKASDTQSLMHKLSDIISYQTSIGSEVLLNKLLSSEKEFKWSIGDGVSLPHIRLSNISKPIKIFIKLQSLVNINSIDEIPVDLIYMIISPVKDGTLHLRKISTISRKLKDHDFADKLRSADSEDEIIAIFTNNDKIMEYRPSLGILNNRVQAINNVA